jgi:hypothetical protein
MLMKLSSAFSIIGYTINKDSLCFAKGGPLGEKVWCNFLFLRYVLWASFMVIVIFKL